MLMGLAALCGLVAFVCAIIILIHAFSKGGVVQGLLSFFVPFYIIYYGFARFEHPKKAMIVWGMLGAFILQFVLIVMGAGAAIMSNG